MKALVMVAFIASAALTGCSKPEPCSQEYFSAHLDEARRIVTDCREGSVGGDDCANADYAIQLADAHERNRRFFKPRKTTPAAK